MARMQKMVGIWIEQDSWETEYLIFEVPLPSQNPVYMSFRLNEYNRENSGIVIVDSRRFLDLWRRDPFQMHVDLANGNPTTWPNDEKYEHAVTGFSFGNENPVPLALVSCEQHKSIEYMAITNGITRTIWLLTNACAAFPVECSASNMNKLHKAAGVEGTFCLKAGGLAQTVELT